MTTLNLQIPTVGQPNATEDPKIVSSLNAISSWAAGGIDSTNMSVTAGVTAAQIAAAFAQSASVNQAGQTVKGVSAIATSQSTASSSFTTLATPDQVTGLTVPANGIVRVWYRATVQEATLGSFVAAIFIGSNQLRVPAFDGTSGPLLQAATTQGNGTANTNLPLFSTAAGLATASSSTAYSGDVTTGQAAGYVISSGTANRASMFIGNGPSTVLVPVGVPVGGPCDIVGLPAGTYTISVQYKSLISGNVTAANRVLAVQVLSFS